MGGGLIVCDSECTLYFARGVDSCDSNKEKLKFLKCKATNFRVKVSGLPLMSCWID